MVAEESGKHKDEGELTLSGKVKMEVIKSLI